MIHRSIGSMLGHLKAVNSPEPNLRTSANAWNPGLRTVHLVLWPLMHLALHVGFMRFLQCHQILGICLFSVQVVTSSDLSVSGPLRKQRLVRNYPMSLN